MVEKVEMYKTSDGSLFLSEQDADAHQRMFDAKIKLLDEITEKLGRHCDEDDIFSWLIENAAEVRKLLEPWDESLRESEQ